MEVPHEKLLVEQVVDLVFQIWFDRIPLKLQVAKSCSSSYQQYEVSQQIREKSFAINGGPGGEEDGKESQGGSFE